MKSVDFPRDYPYCESKIYLLMAAVIAVKLDSRNNVHIALYFVAKMLYMKINNEKLRSKQIKIS